MTNKAADDFRPLYEGARQGGRVGLTDVARLIGDRFACGCLILFRSHQASTLVPVGGHHEADGVASYVAEFLGAPSSFTSTRTLALLSAGATVLVSASPEHLDTWLGSSHATKTDLRSVLTLPVREHGRQVLAAVMLGRHGDQPRFTRADRAALEGMADGIGEALERDWLAWELRQVEASEARTAGELQLAQERFTAAFRHAPVGLAVFSVGLGSSVLLEVNPHLAALVGTSEDELLRHTTPLDFVHPEDAAGVAEAYERLLAGEAGEVVVEARMRRADGELRLCRVALSLVRDAHGDVRYGLCQAVDITASRRDRARVERHVRGQRALAAIGRRAVEEGTWEGLAAAALPALVEALETDHACVLSAEPGGAPRVVVGAEGFDLTRPLPEHPTAYATRELPVAWLARGVRAALVAPIALHADVHSWLAVLSRSDVEIGEQLTFVEAAAHLLAAAEERREAEAGARRRALLDPLTRLPNRTLFCDRVAHAVARAERERSMLAVIRLDVNRFTDVNETFGHGVGDDLIVALADRLTEALRADDSLGRIGGDEFGVLVERVGDERGTLAVVGRVMRAFDAPVVLGERSLHVSAGIGIAIGGGKATAEGLMRDADTAMRRAKERVGTAYELFDVAMRRRVVQRLQLEQDLRRALDRDQFLLHYQPLVSLQERRIVGVEALVRWEHPERGMVSPADFVPVAEETGLIVPLGTWVLEEACRQLARWQTDIYVSVNLSGRQLAVPGLADEVARTLRRTGIPPGRLALELTETVLMAETTSPTAILQALHGLGVKLLLDDFGTGYSSLNYVKRFPLHGLKVDRSFIAGLPQDESDRALLRAIGSMASALDIAVLAEGVETLEQASWLAGMDCDVAQGFGLARPAPADVIGALLRDGLPPERLRWTLDAPAEHAGSTEATIPLSEAAEALGVSASTLRRWADADRIEAIRTPGGHRRFPVSEVRRLSRESAARPRGSLRMVEFPTRPVPAFADLLESTDVLPAVVASIYRAGRPGWFASDAAAGMLAQWVSALAAAARTGVYEGALEATQRLLAQADYAGAGLLERHQYLERARDAWLRELRERRASQADLLDVRRTLVRLSHCVLEVEG